MWKSAEILEDFHLGDSALELLLESGAVSKSVTRRFLRVGSQRQLTRSHRCAGQLLPRGPVQTQPAPPSQPGHLGWGERPHCSQLPARTCSSAQLKSAVRGIQDHLHVLRYRCSRIWAAQLRQRRRFVFFSSA